MITDFRTLAPEDNLSRAIEQILAGSQQDFPVVDQGEVVGVLTRGDLLTGLAKNRETGVVRDSMQRNFHTAQPLDMAEKVYTGLDNGHCRTVPVLRDGQLVGMVTLENIGEFMMIRNALHGDAQTISRYPAGLPTRRAA